jgi:hypothetical protein
MIAFNKENKFIVLDGAILSFDIKFIGTDLQN